MDFGNDGSRDWAYEGVFQSTQTLDLKASLQNYLDDPQSCGKESDYCLVPLKLHSDSEGKLSASNLNVLYLETDNKPPVFTAQAFLRTIYSRDGALFSANIFENKELSNATVQIGNETHSLVRTSQTPLFDVMEANFTAGKPGVYKALITAIDSNNLVSKSEMEFA